MLVDKEVAGEVDIVVGIWYLSARLVHVRLHAADAVVGLLFGKVLKQARQPK